MNINKEKLIPILDNYKQDIDNNNWDKVFENTPYYLWYDLAKLLTLSNIPYNVTKNKTMKADVLSYLKSLNVFDLMGVYKTMYPQGPSFELEDGLYNNYVMIGPGYYVLEEEFYKRIYHTIMDVFITYEKDTRSPSSLYRFDAIFRLIENLGIDIFHDPLVKELMITEDATSIENKLPKYKIFDKPE